MKLALARAAAASLSHGAAVTPATAVPAVLLSPLFSTVGIVLYEKWRGSAISLNLWKCSFTAVLFASVVVSTSDALPSAPSLAGLGLSSIALRMLMLSSFLGIVVGDVLWLQALKLLGARVTILQSTLQPLIAALAGAIFLKQPLTPISGVGIASVCAGLALAQSAPPPNPSQPSRQEEDEVASALVETERMPEDADLQRDAHKRLVLGSALNLLNMGLDTAGSVLTRRYGRGCTTWQINMVRFGSAALITLFGLVGFNAWHALAKPDETRPRWAALAPTQPAKVWIAVGCGALLVTFLSPALSSHALFGLPLGIWSALSSLGPVWSVPILFILRRERTSGRGILGAALAVAGAAACSMAARASGPVV